MQSYVIHSNYFGALTRKVRLFSHDRPDAFTSDNCKCFFRMNDELEAQAGQVERMHFPALFHNNYAAKGSEIDGAERLNVVNNFGVLVFGYSPHIDKGDTTTTLKFCAVTLSHITSLFPMYLAARSAGTLDNSSW